MDKHGIYKTSSLPLAGFLVYFNVPLLKVLKDKSTGKKIFEFQRIEGLDDLLEAYFRRTARVEPEGYFFAIKSLKTRLYDFNDEDE
jgi:hypothetical protein